MMKNYSITYLHSIYILGNLFRNLLYYRVKMFANKSTLKASYSGIFLVFSASYPLFRGLCILKLALHDVIQIIGCIQ